MNLDQLILRHLEQHEISDQRVLLELLQSEGLDLTLATLSRHLKKLNVRKEAGVYQRMAAPPIVPVPFTTTKIDQQDEEQGHEGLGDLLDALGDARGDDAAGEDQHGELPEEGLPGAARKGAEGLGRQLRAGEPDGDGLEDVGEHPARHVGVEGHDEHGGGQPSPAHHGPELLSGHHLAVGLDGVEAHPAADDVLHHHDGDAHQGHRQQVGQHEGRAAVGAGQVGELPDVAQADGRTYGGGESAQRGCECIAVLDGGHDD